MEFRVAVVNHSWMSPSMAGWGWSLGEANVPKQFSTREQAQTLADHLAGTTHWKNGDWEFRVIEGPPFILPEPQNSFHANRRELSKNTVPSATSPAGEQGGGGT